MNSSQWYPWAFSFRSTHYALAWVAIGSLLIRIAVKLPVIRAALTEPVERSVAAGDQAPLSRRGLLRTTSVASSLAVLATAGASVPLLRRVSILGVRSGDGPQEVPVNRSAEAAGVLDTADDAGWRQSVRELLCRIKPIGCAVLCTQRARAVTIRACPV